MQAEQQSHLLPCPFCGGEAVRSKTMDESIWSHETVPYHKVYCPECEIGTEYRCEGWDPTAEEAWNTRTALSHPSTPQGWKMVPVEPTPEICAVASIDEGARITDGPAFAGDLYRAMLAASPPAPEQGWQDIESAPKTGRTLLLGCFNSAGNWRTMRGQWMSQEYIDEYWEEPDDVEPGWFETVVESEDLPNCWPIEPTHYMPLPPPPEQGGKG